MNPSKKTFVVLDGNALLHRAWHAIPPLATAEGLVVNAVYGFANVLEKMIPQLKPDSMAVAWDLPGDTFRHEKYEAYKAHREKKAQELYDQIPLIQDMLKLYGIPSIEAVGFEADDIIGTMAHEATKAGMETLIVTGDMDALQLVNEDVKVVSFVKGMSETKTYDIAAVKERYGLDPVQLIDFKTMRGDPSDNLPGIPGIGEKTATELLQQFGTLPEIFAALKRGDIPAKYAKKLTGHEATAELMRELVTVRLDVPLEFDFKTTKLPEPDWEKLFMLWRNYEFRSLLKKHADKNPGVPAPPIVSKGTSKATAMSMLKDEAAVSKFLRELDGDIGVLLGMQAPDLFGTTVGAIALSDGTRTGVIVQPTEAVRKLIFERLTRASRVIAHDLKALMHITGWEFGEKVDDLMLIDYILHAEKRSHELETPLPKSFVTELELRELGTACALFPSLLEAANKELVATGTESVYRTIEMPLIPVLYGMEKTGVEVDGKALDAFAKKLGTRVEELDREIQGVSGEMFNVNSPSQLATILFEKLALPTKGIKKTQTGYSTAAPELEKLEGAHPIIEKIGEYRELSKLKSTYADALPKLIAKDGRIHTTYAQTVAATGRLSSIDPNLQNIPIKTDLGNEIRKAFVASKGKRFVAADYSQIELRLGAVIAKDEPFLRAFKDGVDIHTRTAAEMFGTTESEVTPDQRRAAKAINFGIMYGMGPRALARSTKMSVDEAKVFIEKYFQIHHAMRLYMDETIAKAHAEGFVTTLYGRRRHFPEISSGVPMLVAQAERMAINMPVQGTQADVIKLAMIAVDGWLKRSGWDAKLILSVHDELVVECDANVVAAVAKGMKELMEGAASYEVPLTVEVEVGENWGEMTPLTASS